MSAREVEYEDGYPIIDRTKITARDEIRLRDAEIAILRAACALEPGAQGDLDHLLRLTRHFRRLAAEIVPETEPTHPSGGFAHMGCRCRGCRS